MRLQTSRRIDHPRKLVVTDRTDDGRVSRQGKALLDLAGNDYLGLAQDREVISAAKDALNRFGAGSAASPSITGFTSLHQALCDKLRLWKQVSCATLFPTGYAANLAAVSAIVEPDDVVLCDRLVHASLIDGCRLAGSETRFYRHADVDDLARLMTRYRARRVVVVTEGVFSMDGTRSPLNEIVDALSPTGGTLIVDEAHSNGIFGKHGSGLITGDRAGRGIELIHVGTLSKALGSQGGFIAASEAITKNIVNLGRSFMFSTSLAPPCVGAALAALQRIEEDSDTRQQLAALSDRLRHGLCEQGWTVLGDSSVPIVSVVVGDADRAMALSDLLASRGILAPAIRPPTVKPGTSRLRLSVNAKLSAADIDLVLQSLDELKDAPDR